MTKERSDNQFMQNGADGAITGISTCSFLQMLEQDRHSCKVKILSKGRHGLLYFEDGNLIDAMHGQVSGIDAACTIIAWDDPSIAISDSAARTRQITQPLGFILLNSAKQKDEQDEEPESQVQPTTAPPPSNNIKESSVLRSTIAILSKIEDIRYFCILDRTGKVVFNSAPDPTLGEITLYCIISSSNLRKTLQVQSPRSIHMQMNDGSSLLIMPKSGKIFGLLIEASSSAAAITNRIKADFSAT